MHNEVPIIEFIVRTKLISYCTIFDIMSIRRSSSGRKRTRRDNNRKSSRSAKPVIKDSFRDFQYNSARLILDGMYELGMDFNESDEELLSEFCNEYLDPNYKDANILPREREQVFDDLVVDFMEFIYNKGYDFNQSGDQIIEEIKADIDIDNI